MMDGEEETVDDVRIRLEKGFRHGFIGVDSEMLEAEIEMVRYILNLEGKVAELALFEEGARSCHLL